MPLRSLGLLLALAACTTATNVSSPARGPATSTEPAAEVRGLQNVQRTLRLLDESQAGTLTGPVRILFYGQSITQSAWSRKVEQTLRLRYPRANLWVENRALGAFHAELLASTAESDLYPAYPDLVIFHVYGDHHRYEDVVRRLRERTTAELLLQTDHVTKPEELDEPTDPRLLAAKGEQWSAFMNGAFLPGLVARYGVALCDQRSAWKEVLQREQLAPSALLLDGLHVNSRGDALMASLVASCLRRDAALDPAPADAWVRTLQVGRDVSWSESRELELVFEGNRIDAVVAGGGSALTVSIDRDKPSHNPALYTFARAHAREGGKWPPIHDLSTQLALGALRHVETFTLEVHQESAAALAGGHEQSAPRYVFSARGDVTGADGEGRSDVRFVSPSGRLVIDPEDWNVAYTFALAGRDPPPAAFTVDLRVEPHFTDSVASLPGGARDLRVITLAEGLPNTQHTLLLTRAEHPLDGLASSATKESPDSSATLVALRVYRPPLDRH
jgi:hypothetical protein